MPKSPMIAGLDSAAGYLYEWKRARSFVFFSYHMPLASKDEEGRGF